MTDLTIPPAAVDAHFVCGCSESGIRAGYKPEALYAVVAAELRRLAAESAAAHPDFSDEGWSISPADLRARADKLDPQP